MAVYQNHTYLQFDQATNLNNLLAGLAPYLTIDEQTFYDDFFNIITCNGDGLDNWGKLLNTTRTIYTPDVTQCFGFDTGVTPSPIDTGYPQNFGQGNFWGGQQQLTTLTDDEYRVLLRAKYFSITTNASLGSINYIMNYLISFYNSTYKAYVYQSALMEITLKVNFYFSDVQYAIFSNRDFMPIPVGVNYLIIQGAVL